jgi:phosphoribosylaminoimidazole-succinocarboxamide synthase
MSIVLETSYSGLKRPKRGKVRDNYDIGQGQLLIVTTDRISAFDVVSKQGIPGKGEALNVISNRMFALGKGVIENHLIETDLNKFPPNLRARKSLRGRSVIARKADEVIPFEFVYREYITGSGIKEYKATREKTGIGSICGVKLPDGLREADKLDQIIFTPATKAEEGQHDDNVPFERLVEKLGRPQAEEAREVGLELFRRCSEYAAKRGLILADTKFEFGYYKGKLIWIDEAATPDSSRYWFSDKYVPGQVQESVDKQFVRNFLETKGWNKKPPMPRLPSNVVEETARRYAEVRKILLSSV